MNTEQMIHKYFGSAENPYELFQANHFKLKIENAMKGDVISLNGHKWDVIKEINKTSEKNPVNKQPVYYIELGVGNPVRRTGDVVVDAVKV